MDEIEKAYTAEVNQVERLLGKVVSSDDPDRLIIEPWANTVAGPILDVGSGTGRWTGHLTNLGHDVIGLEPAERLLLIARQTHPEGHFCRGSIDDLAHIHQRWVGILVWYSIIHMAPTELHAALVTLRRVLKDNGTMLLSFFSGLRLEPWEHPVATAYRWPMHDLVQMLQDTGFEITAQYWDANAPHAYVIARASQGPITAGPRHRRDGAAGPGNNMRL